MGNSPLPAVQRIRHRLDEVGFPREPLRVSPEIDVHHRLMLARARRADDRDTIVETAINLSATALEQVGPQRVNVGRPATAAARRRLANAAREAIAANEGKSLSTLAKKLAVSPHHLSRVFRAETGETVTRHRLRLRARQALELIAQGERDLSRLAADLGFVDQSHLCRVLRVETGHTPSTLREMLA